MRSIDRAEIDAAVERRLARWDMPSQADLEASLAKDEAVRWWTGPHDEPELVPSALDDYDPDDRLYVGRGGRMSDETF